MDYRGIAALIIAASLGLAIVIGIAGLVFWRLPLGEAGGEALIAIGGALAGALAGFIGGRMTGGD